MSGQGPGAAHRNDPRAIRGREGATTSRPKILAFYLPQFHPIPENDEWWEPGFTEWTNVVRARPLFPGHYQPHLPGELGYYDLRVPEVREKQAALARRYGIHGFVYYHYWFQGRRLLHRPFDEVLSSGRPDFPFALCWANEEWTRNWDALSGSVLVEQRFSEADDLAHIRWLVKAFSDERYITIDGRPLMLVYRSDLLPDPKATTDLWRTETRAAGFPDLYLAMVESRRKNDDPRPMGFDASVGFRSDAYVRLTGPVDAFREHTILDYDAAQEAALNRPAAPWRRFPGVMVGWDNSPRRRSGAVIFSGGTPEAYERWLRRTIESVSDVREEENLIFVAAWNEWAEGNHLEPDQRYGRGYLEATLRALQGADPPAEPSTDIPEASSTDGSGATRTEGTADRSLVLDPDSPAGHAFRLVCSVIAGPRRAVEIGSATPGLSSAFAEAGIDYRPIGREADGGDVDALLRDLEKQGEVGALLIGPALEHWPEPSRLFVSLSEWASSHGEPPLVVSAANIAHFDIGLLLLSGRWGPPDDRTGRTAARYFTRVTLEQLLQRSGWEIMGSDDRESMFSPRHPAALEEDLPEAMAGALRVLAQSYNPDWAVEHFIWAVRPVGVEELPASYADADNADIADRSSEWTVSDLPADASQAVRQYLASVGLLAGGTHVRAEGRLRRARTQMVRKRLQKALAEFVVSDRWAEELPLLADTVDDLTDLYLARDDLANIFDTDEAFDAVGFVRWAIGDQPQVAAAVSRLTEKLRRETSEAIREVLSTSKADRQEIEAATDALVDLYLNRWDLRFTVEGGTAVDTTRLLSWAVSVRETDDPSAARLARYRALIQSALAASAAPPPRRWPVISVRPRSRG